MWIQTVGGGGVEHIAYASDGRTLYTFDRGGWVTEWDITTRKGQRRFQLGSTDRYNARGMYVVNDGRYLVIQALGRAIVWDIGASALVPDLPDSLGFSDIRPARSGSGLWVVGTDRKGIDAYDVPPGRPTRVLSAPPELGALVWFDASPDGTVLLTDINRHSVLVRPNGSAGPLAVPFKVITNMSFAPDGRSLMLRTYYRMQVWDAASLAVRIDSVACTAGYSVFAFHPLAPVFAALNLSRQLTLFDLNTGAVVRSLDFALGNYVQCVAFAPDGLTCAVGGSNKRFAVFDVDL
jgi:WD40 repeat protein